MAKTPMSRLFKRIAAASHGRFYLAPAGSGISDDYQQIADELQNDYQLTWNTPELSGHSALVAITLQYQGQSVSVTQRAELTGSKPLGDSEQSKTVSTGGSGQR